MAVKNTDSYLSYPPYQQAMHDLQSGKWQEGLAGLAEVEKKYPLDTELRVLRQEMQIRARIDEYEVEENKASKIRNWRQVITRVILGALIVTVLLGAITTYSGWLQSQWSSAQQSISSEIQQNTLWIKFNNARQLLKAGQTDESLKILEEISQVDSAYPGLTEVMQEAQAQQALENEYARAVDMLAAGNSQDALAILQMISERAPNFRDVSLKIQAVQAEADMDASLAQADQAYAEQRWDDAINGYEALRLLDPEYQRSQVESKLFQTYIQAASSVLGDAHPSLESLQIADNYFSQALSLRPQDREAVAARTAVRTTIEDRMVADYIQQAQAELVGEADSLAALAAAEALFARALELRPNDPNVLVQFQLAQNYLAAVESFAARDYDAVIADLETVVSLDVTYANGTALQTLYEAYIGRGQASVSIGNYLYAIQDFQRAATLAQLSLNPLATYLEAQIMIAEAEGLSGNYQSAVAMYQAALFDSGLRDIILASDTPLVADLLNAESAAAQGNAERAFQLYRTLLHSRTRAYNSAEITIKGGDYLTSLARQFGTTVTAILEANQLTTQDTLDDTTVLNIPTLP